MENVPITKIEALPCWAISVFSDDHYTITGDLFNTKRVRTESPRNEYETYRHNYFLFLKHNKYRIIVDENERVILFLSVKDNLFFFK